MSGADGDQRMSGRTATTNGKLDVEKKPPQYSGPLIRSPFRAMVQDFSPIWFTWCMNSGVIGILLHQHPYQFEGIRTLSIIAFCVDLLCFFVFSTLFISRLAMFRRQAFNEITNDITQLTLVACWVIGFMTIVSLITLLVSESYWGGWWATMLAYVLWWFSVAWTLFTLFFVFMIIVRRHMAGGGSETPEANTHHNPIPTTVIIPAVAVVTLALTGAIVASYGSHMTARLAVPVVITALPLCGIGMLLAVLLYAILFRQLLEGGFPAPPQVNTLFVYVGPFGQSAAALQAFGAASRAWFGEYDRGTFLTGQASSPFEVSCVLGALLLLGPAVFFTFISIYGLIDVAITTKQVQWNPTWNSIIFPVATMTTATTYMAMELDSTAFKVLTSIQLICLVIVYFVNAFFTIRGIIKGELLIIREDPRIKKQMEEQKEK